MRECLEVLNYEPLPKKDFGRKFKSDADAGTGSEQLQQPDTVYFKKAGAGRNCTRLTAFLTSFITAKYQKGFLCFILATIKNA